MQRDSSVAAQKRISVAADKRRIQIKIQMQIQIQIQIQKDT